MPADFSAYNGRYGQQYPQQPSFNYPSHHPDNYDNSGYFNQRAPVMNTNPMSGNRQFPYGQNNNNNGNSYYPAAPQRYNNNSKMRPSPYAGVGPASYNPYY
ncbi:hypothetical protein L596_004404 [Steinernema carpocapsae]|nr:hypothetical protein L596_004404 [Steinernema carpocapsae]